MSLYGWGLESGHQNKVFIKTHGTVTRTSTSDYQRSVSNHVLIGDSDAPEPRRASDQSLS